MLFGFGTMLLRLWQGELPRTVLVAWDTLEVPTYRHEALDVYQSAEFEAELLEQLDLLPALVASSGLAYAKAPGYEADDFLGAAVSAEEERGGTVLVATSDRDAFRSPARGPRFCSLCAARHRLGSGLVVRERYGVDPEQVPDFIALRGDPSDRIRSPRDRAEEGGGPARTVRVAGRDAGEGRFAAEADALRLYRRIATLDRAAPLPPLPDVEPDWDAAAAHARQLGMNGLAGRFEEAAAST